MTETKCNWCPRDVSKHDQLALQICLLKAIREAKANAKSNGIEEITDIETSVKSEESDDS
jgi:hypothetical protein